MPGDRVLVGTYGPKGEKGGGIRTEKPVRVSDRQEKTKKGSEKFLRKVFGEYVGTETAQEIIKKISKGGGSVQWEDIRRELTKKKATKILKTAERNFKKEIERGLKLDEQNSPKDNIEKAGQVGELAERGIGREALSVIMKRVSREGNRRLKILEGLDPENDSSEPLLMQSYSLIAADFVGSSDLSDEERSEFEAEINGFNEEIGRVHDAKRDEREAWLFTREEAREADGHIGSSSEKSGLEGEEPSSDAGAVSESADGSQSEDVLTKNQGQAQAGISAKSGVEEGAVSDRRKPERIFGPAVAETGLKKLFKPDGHWIVVQDLDSEGGKARVEFGNPKGESKVRLISPDQLEDYLKRYKFETPNSGSRQDRAVAGKSPEAAIGPEVAELRDRKLFKPDGHWLAVRSSDPKNGKIEVEFGNPSGESQKRRINRSELSDYLGRYVLDQAPEPEGKTQETQEIPEMSSEEAAPDRSKRETGSKSEEYGTAKRIISESADFGAERSVAKAMLNLNRKIETDGKRKLRRIEMINPDSDMAEQHLKKDYLMRMDDYDLAMFPAEERGLFEAKIASFNREISVLLEGKLAQREEVLAVRAKEKPSAEAEVETLEPQAERMLQILQKYQGRLAEILRFIRAIDIEKDEVGTEFARVPKRIYTDINMGDLSVEEMRQIVEAVNEMNERIEKAYNRKKGMWEARQLARKTEAKKSEKKQPEPVKEPEPTIPPDSEKVGNRDQAESSIIPEAVEGSKDDKAVQESSEPVAADSPAENASGSKVEKPKEPGLPEKPAEAAKAERLVEDADLEKVEREVDEARRRYVQASRKSSSLVAKLKEFFGSSANVPGSDDAAAIYLEQYQEKSRQLLKLKVERLKMGSRRRGTETHRQAMEMIKYFTFDEKIKLYETGNSVRAEEVEKRFGKWPGSLAKKFSSVINRYRKLDWKFKMAMSSMLFASGAGLAVKGVFRAFTSTASAVGFGGMYEAWQRRKDVKELEAEQKRIREEVSKVSPEESYQKMMELLSVRIGQYDRTLTQQKKRRWGKWAVGLGAGLGAFLVGPKIFQSIREYLGGDVGIFSGEPKMSHQAVGPSPDDLERSFNAKLGNDWGVGRLEYDHDAGKVPTGDYALKYKPEIGKLSLLTPEELDRKIQGMLSGGKTLEVVGRGNSIESTLIRNLEEGGLSQQEAGPVAHRMALQYAKDQGLEFERLNLVHEGAEIKLSPDGSRILSVADHPGRGAARAVEFVQSADAPDQIESAVQGSAPEVSEEFVSIKEPDQVTPFGQDLMGPAGQDAHLAMPESEAVTADIQPAAPETSAPSESAASSVDDLVQTAESGSAAKIPEMAPDNLPELGDIDEYSIKQINESLAEHLKENSNDFIKRDWEVSSVINRCLAEGDFAAWKAGKDTLMEEILAKPHGSQLAQQANRLYNHFMDMAGKNPEIAEKIKSTLPARPNETLENWTGRISSLARVLKLERI